MATPITQNVNANPLVASEFSRGRGYTNYRPRGSGDWLLIGTLGGAGRVVAGKSTMRLEPGSALLFGPTAMQDYSTDPSVGGWHLRWAHFVPRPHWMPWLRWPEVAPMVGAVQLTGTAKEAFFDALGRMLVVERLAGPHAIDLAMNALEAALLWAHRVVSEDPIASIDRRVQAAVDYLAKHPAEPFRMEVLATKAGLSSSRLAHLFREEMGVTPQRYSEQLRLRLAEQLLVETNLTVAEIAGEIGFADALYFSRRFRRMKGTSPLMW